MKQGGRSDGWIMPTEEDIEVAEILMNLSKFIQKSELISGYSFTWGQKKKRSVLDSKPESLPSGGDKKTLKSKETEDLMEIYKMQQEREILKKKLKAKGQKINYSRNMEENHIWDSSMETFDQQRCHQQITMFAPSTSQSVVDPNNGKVEAVSCSCNSNSGGGFGMFNQIDPRGKIHGEPYDFMASSQPLDQSKYLLMDSDLKVRAAEAARKRRMLKMKQNKNSLLTLKLWV